MAAYAAVISLKHTINGLQKSSRISLIPSTQEYLEVAHNEATSLQQVLERSNESSRSRSSHERLDGLEGQIRDFAHKLEDVLEFHEYLLIDGDAEEAMMRQEISSFGEAVKKIEKDYIQELSRDDNDSNDDAATSVLSRIGFGVEMVGHSIEFNLLRDYLVDRMRPDDLCFFACLGEHGSGRSVPAKIIFEGEREGRTQFFECWAWVTVGSTATQEVLMSIISQLVDNPDYELIISREDEDEGVEKLSEYLYKLLEDRRYMIVLDDVDDVELVNYLRSNSFPDQSNGSMIILTTNSEEVDRLAYMRQNHATPPHYFDQSIWIALRQLVFGMDSVVPAEMEVAGKKIIRNCRCRFITAIKTLLFLLESERTVEEWSKIAADEQNPIFMVADEISEISQIIMRLQYYNREFAEMVISWLDYSYFVEDFKKKIRPERFFSKMQIISFFGMAGIGKTTFASKLFKDKSILSHFDHHVWIYLGPKYQMEDILLDILALIYPNIQKLHMKGDEKLVGDLCVQLSRKRCLIVLDDLCSKEPLLHLRKLFPNIKGTTLFTTRLAKVAKFGFDAKLGMDDYDFELQLLDKEESWCLLHNKVFGGGLCPRELEKVGRKIAEKCDGLPLLILTVGDQLLKAEISLEY